LLIFGTWGWAIRDGKILCKIRRGMTRV
jgi:hypothetical protein